MKCYNEHETAPLGFVEVALRINMLHGGARLHSIIEIIFRETKMLTRCSVPTQRGAAVFNAATVRAPGPKMVEYFSPLLVTVRASM